MSVLVQVFVIAFGVGFMDPAQATPTDTIAPNTTFAVQDMSDDPAKPSEETICQPTVYHCHGEGPTQPQACANAIACAVDAGACWYQTSCSPGAPDCALVKTFPEKYDCGIAYKLP